MNSTHYFILDSLKDEPIGETIHFVWYITDIGIAALFKENKNLKFYNSNVEKEAKNISLDIVKKKKNIVNLRLKSSSSSTLSFNSFNQYEGSKL